MITETISTVELAWTLISFIAASASFWSALFFLRLARLARQENLEWGLQWLARGRFALRMFLVTGQLALTLAGYAQMFLPPPNVDTPVTLGGLITLVLLVLGNAFFTACALGEILMIEKVKRIPIPIEDPLVIAELLKMGANDTL